MLNSTVIWQKGESENVCYKKTKYTKFSEKRTFFLTKIFLTLCYAHGPTTQNGQTHSDNPLPANCLSMFDHFVGLAHLRIGLKNNCFWKIWRVCFFCNTRFDIRPFALLLTNYEWYNRDSFFSHPIIVTLEW